jgi:hypothetical protein
MKKGFGKIFAVVALMWGTNVSAAPVMVESWASLDTSGIGTYADSNGSTVKYSTEKGPKKKEKALRLESDLKSGGYCGIWHSMNVEVGRAAVLVFVAKSDKAGDVQMALKDKNNVQYITTFTLSAGGWKGVTLDLASFKKDPYYTPPDAVTGNPVDFSTLKGMNVSPQIVGASMVFVGPIQAEGEVKAPEAKSVEPAGAGVGVESWASAGASDTGVYSDTNGSKVAFELAEGPKTGEKALKIAGELKTGGYLGIWHNVTVNLSGASSLRFQAKASVQGTVQIALKDKNNVEYIAPFQVGTQWAEVSLSLSDLVKNPYYTPPDAVTGKAMDLSETKTMNFAPQAAGSVTVWVGPVEAVSTKK